ncbi:hypothetical protein RhiirA5_409828 [Rhizophagus irregularis]|uniref:Uncharacterized protein n=1 Tax=Rhizophagus irregularis TaxID=588596 RepID=A0A2N0Q4U0_9GLOM|nr:hypothetical protein RhiirA5_409828 [Rhizophagus irregularis]
MKILLKELPTYDTLFKRETEGITNEFCKRCDKDENNNEEVELLREINFDFIRIIEQPSVILRGMNRAWEIVRGVYNANFNNLSNKKEGKKIVKKLWNFIYEEIKKRIWIKRCEDIAEIEKKEGIEKKTLKKRRSK